MTYWEFHRWLQARLGGLLAAGEVRGHAELLEEALFELPPYTLLQHPGQEVPASVQARALGYLEELAEGCPVQYVLGYGYFYNRCYMVNGATLIPRPETEEVCARALMRLEGGHGRVLDLGTGCGCIAVTLALVGQLQRVEGLDVREETLAVARANAQRLGASVSFWLGDMLDGTLLVGREPYDLLVSNPPYIPERERAGLMPRVAEWEPERALFVADADPIVFYRALARHALRGLRAGGWLVCETHADYADAVAQHFGAAGLREVAVLRDGYGRNRIVEARR